MGLLDTVKGWFGGNKAKVQDTVASQSDTIKSGIDKGGDVVDDKTGGKVSGQVDAAQDKAKDVVDDVGGGATPSA